MSSEDNQFQVPSFTRDGVLWIVNTSVGGCTCPIGQFGRFCKHAAVVYDTFKQSAPTAPTLSPEQKSELFRLATGQQNVNVELFQPLTNSRPQAIFDNTLSQTSADSQQATDNQPTMIGKFSLAICSSSHPILVQFVGTCGTLFLYNCANIFRN